MANNRLTKIINSAELMYAIRCIIGFSIGYYLYLNYNEHEILWMILSIILVISPEGINSRKLTVERFKSNLIGSIVGLICIEIHDPNIYIILFGIVLTIVICSLFKILNMARVALVALVVILVQPVHDLSELTPIIRCLSVTIGCLIGLIIVLITSAFRRKLRQIYNIPTP